MSDDEERDLWKGFFWRVDKYGWDCLLDFVLCVFFLLDEMFVLIYYFIFCLLFVLWKWSFLLNVIIVKEDLFVVMFIWNGMSCIVLLKWSKKERKSV